MLVLATEQEYIISEFLHTYLDEGEEIYIEMKGGYFFLKATN